MTQWLIFAAGILIPVIIIVAAVLLSQTRWRKCRVCHWFYNDTGEIISHLPSNSVCATAPGLCADCGGAGLPVENHIEPLEPWPRTSEPKPASKTTEPPALITWDYTR